MIYLTVKLERQFFFSLIIMGETFDDLFFANHYVMDTINKFWIYFQLHQVLIKSTRPKIQQHIVRKTTLIRLTTVLHNDKLSWQQRVSPKRSKNCCKQPRVVRIASKWLN